MLLVLLLSLLLFNIIIIGTSIVVTTIDNTTMIAIIIILLLLLRLLLLHCRLGDPDIPVLSCHSGEACSEQHCCCTAGRVIQTYLSLAVIAVRTVLLLLLMLVLLLLLHCRPGDPDVPVLGCDSGADGGVQHHRGHLHLAAPRDGGASRQHAKLLLAVPHRYAQTCNSNLRGNI